MARRGAGAAHARVLAVAVGDEAPAFLALEWIARRRRAAGHDERSAAASPRCTAPARRRSASTTTTSSAALPQANATAADAGRRSTRERRLEPLLARAVDAGGLDRHGSARLERLAARWTTSCGPAEPPARLHGDLWGGNAMADEHGAPVLIDPAVYGGHREIDLAMMRLFGGFGARVFAAYDEAYPLAAGHAGSRRALPALPAAGARQPLRRQLRRAGRARAAPLRRARAGSPGSGREGPTDADRFETGSGPQDHPAQVGPEPRRREEGLER